jgi:hypothetical protein
LLSRVLQNTSIVIHLTFQNGDWHSLPCKLLNVEQHPNIHHIHYDEYQSNMHHKLLCLANSCVLKPLQWTQWVHKSISLYNINKKLKASYASWSPELIPINDSVCSSSPSEILWGGKINQQYCNENFYVPMNITPTELHCILVTSKTHFCDFSKFHINLFFNDLQDWHIKKMIFPIFLEILLDNVFKRHF